MNIMTVIFNGLSTSSILLITALGLAITFGLMRVVFQMRNVDKTSTFGNNFWSYASY